MESVESVENGEEGEEREERGRRGRRGKRKESMKRDLLLLGVATGCTTPPRVFHLIIITARILVILHTIVAFRVLKSLYRSKRKDGKNDSVNDN